MTSFFDLFNVSSPEPDFWNNYKDLFSKETNKETSLDEIGFTVFDTESTGLDLQKDSLVSIAAIKVISNRIIVDKSLDLLVRQDNWKGNESIHIHEIMPDNLKESKFEI